MEIIRATSPDDFADGRSIFVEYAESLGFSLCFQGFDRELETLESTYAPPGGVLLLARERGETAGCVAVMGLGDGGCEMRRLYVRPAFRSLGLGRRLAAAAIDEARTLGFSRMTLHTLARMERARAMYPMLGFQESARGDGPDEAVFMSLDLSRLVDAARPAGSSS